MINLLRRTGLAARRPWRNARKLHLVLGIGRYVRHLHTANQLCARTDDGGADVVEPVWAAGPPTAEQERISRSGNLNRYADAKREFATGLHESLSSWELERL
jgi:hypothetical protein